MEVKLLHHTPLWVAAGAIRTCWASQEKSDTSTVMIDGYYEDPTDFFCDFEVPEAGDKDKELIERIGNKFKHKSTLEHLVYNFKIVGISRAVLQELARHRTASLSVKSSRYTLKELKEEMAFARGTAMSRHHYDRASKYLVMTGNEPVDRSSILALENLRVILQSGVGNDKAKYCMPESYKTELTWTMDARNLQSFLELRTNKAALWEIRDLAYAIFEAIPEEHKYLFGEYLYQEKDTNENV